MKSCLRNILIILCCVLVMFGGLFTFLNKLSHTYTSQEISPVRVEEVKILMKYHGAYIAKYEDQQWYFLGKGGRWLPLKTKGACRYLASLSAKPADAVCLF